MAEYWDLYDKNKNKLERVAKRGEKLNAGEYHLVVNVWIKNEKDEFLISRRSPNKSHPLMWECTGGSVLKGETSLEGALRETSEELGITLDKKDAIFIGRANRYYPNCSDILEVWLFNVDTTKTEKIKIQLEEVENAKWASVDEIKEIYEKDNFLVNPYFESILSSVKE
jgi:isopentenyldiphosphate isomerase